MSFWIQVCHLLHDNRYDNSFGFGSVQRSALVVWYSNCCTVKLLYWLLSKEFCCLALFVGKSWLKAANSSFLWYWETVERQMTNQCWAKKQLIWISSSCWMLLWKVQSVFWRLVLSRHPYKEFILENFMQILLLQLLSSGANVLEHKREIFLISGHWGKVPLMGMLGDASM